MSTRRSLVEMMDPASATRCRRGGNPRVSRQAARSIAELAHALEDDVAVVRRDAAKALGSQGSEALPHVFKLATVAAKDVDPEVRKNVAAALAALCPELEHSLLAGNVAQRTGAATAFRAMGGAAAPYAAPLARALQDSRSDVRCIAAEALGQVGPAALPYIAELAVAAEDKHGFVRQSVVKALRALMPELTKALQEGRDVQLCRGAVKAFGALGSAAEPQVELLARKLLDEDALVRGGAAEALGLVGLAAHPHIDELTKTAFDDDEGVRESVAKASGTLVPKLAAALRDRSVDERVDAAAALGALSIVGGPHVVQLTAALVEAALQDECAVVRSKAEKALEVVPANLVVVVQGDDVAARSSAVKALRLLSSALEDTRHDFGMGCPAKSCRACGKAVLNRGCQSCCSRFCVACFCGHATGTSECCASARKVSLRYR
mmetsp:Transcript_35237/g.89636  ORF Transcript_35237/g.89636 Transcript_35237/m.89636 type:complete len:436 (-) Transcript_35237:311-1618(-)